MATSRLVVVEADSAGVRRVRVGRSKSTNGCVLIDGRSHTMTTVATSYLDGHYRVVTTAGSYYQEDEMPRDVVPARSKDVTDFGRLTAAAKALAVSMAEFGADNPPSAAQVAAFIGGYRNLLEWRRKVREQMMQAEGQIDMVETMLGQFL